MTISPRKATWLASLGAGLEYYDFIIYGLMVSSLNTLFFPSSEAWIGVMKGFAVFAIGYFARAFGGLFFGLIGDTFGRKKAFVSVMLLMAIATFAIGLLPTYATLGLGAPVLLLLCRLAQGLSFGAEMPGAITVVTEYAKPAERSIYSSFVVSSTSIGSILASLILYLVSKNLAPESLLSWGWRLPFLLGGLLAVANYYIRKRLQETPEFAALPQPHTQLKQPLALLRLTPLLIGLGLTVFPGALIVFCLYLPSYLAGSYPASDVYLSLTFGLIWSALSLPVCGWLADRFGRLTLYLAASLGSLFLLYPLFHLLGENTFPALLLFVFAVQTILSLLMATYFPLLAASFPTAARYTGIGLCYNIVMAIMGASPLFLTYAGTQAAPPFLLACALLSAFCAFAKKK